MLLGRASELNYLNNYYDKDGSQILIVYGQKHIGKTALVREFMKDKPNYYYLARACSEREQVYQWGRQLAVDGYNVDDFPSFHDILAKIAHRNNGKTVIVIDEFQHIVKVYPNGDGTKLLCLFHSFVNVLFQQVKTALVINILNSFLKIFKSCRLYRGGGKHIL